MAPKVGAPFDLSVDNHSHWQFVLLCGASAFGKSCLYMKTHVEDLDTVSFSLEFEREEVEVVEVDLEV